MSLPARKIAIIASKRSHNQYHTINKVLNNQKRFYAKIFYPIWKGEPSINDVKKNVAEIIDFKPDWIVAIGGGSIIDGAKLIWALYENPNIDLGKLHIPFSIPKLRKKAKFVAVPTTAGTGSEASSSAIITS